MAFQMVSDNATIVQRKLDRILARRPKFICINDNMNHSSPGSVGAVVAVKGFLNDYFPRPSSFELAPGRENAFLHTWEAPPTLARRLGWTDPLAAGLDPVYAASFPRRSVGHTVPRSAALLLFALLLLLVAAAAWRVLRRPPADGGVLPC